MLWGFKEGFLVQCNTILVQIRMIGLINLMWNFLIDFVHNFSNHFILIGGQFFLNGEWWSSIVWLATFLQSIVMIVVVIIVHCFLIITKMTTSRSVPYPTSSIIIAIHRHWSLMVVSIRSARSHLIHRLVSMVLILAWLRKRLMKVLIQTMGCGGEIVIPSQQKKWIVRC